MEDWVLSLRSHFPAARGGGYLNAAYDLGGANFMAEAAQGFFSEWKQAARGSGRAHFAPLKSEARQLVNKLLQSGEEHNVCFTHNTNEGITMAVMGFDYRDGDNIVTFRYDFPSVVAPCLNAARLRGVEVRFAPFEQEGMDDVDAITALCDAHTRLVVVSQLRSVSGWRLDVERLGAFCRERGIFLIVDATQCIGTLPLYPEAWGISAVSAAGYKSMLSAIGTGFFYCCDELARHITPIFVSYNDYTELKSEGEARTLVFKEEADIRKLESGTVDFLALSVMKKSLEVLTGIGVENIEAHIAPLYEKLYRGLEALGYDIVTPFAREKRAHALAVRIAGDQDAIYAHFRSCGIALTNAKHIRFGIPAFATEEDIDMALQAAAKTEIR